MTGATCCSGIGAPETALPGVDWKWAAEVERFPSRVLSERHPGTTNLGDITAPDFIDRAKAFGHINLLVAGTPCQAFSVAGNRDSLDDARGNLTLRFVEIVDAIRPDIVLWENVPGVLSTKDNAFGCFLSALVGADAAIVPKRGWTNAGMVSGTRRNAAWRVLDAQYFGLAQRRKRVFVVSCPRNGADPRKILFECEGVPRHSPPRREAGEGTAADVAARAGIGGGGREVGHTLKAKANSDHREDSETFVISPISLDEEQNATVDYFGTLKARMEGGGFEGSVFVPDNSHCLNAGGMGRIDYETETLVAHTLTKRYDSSEDGCGRETPLLPVAFQSKASPSQSMNPSEISPSLDVSKSDGLCVAFSCKDPGADAGELAPTLRSMGHDGSHANGGGQVAVAFDTTQVTSKANYSNPKPGDPCHPLASTAHPPSVALSVAIRGRDGVPQVELGEDIANAILTPNGGRGGIGVGATLTRLAVRRLTPVECERLQGFPDDYTALDRAADGPRYKALGNSMAVPVIRWIGNRIAGALGRL